jgi:hypothetical protein
MPKHYAWSEIRFGGKVEEVVTPLGAKRSVVVERNVIQLGDEVSKGKLKVDDDVWDHLVESGSIRPYPLPEEADEYTSPTQAVLNRLMKGQGEIDQDMLMELALAHPPAINPPADEAEDVPEGE